jgi:hypothetical protein
MLRVVPSLSKDENRSARAAGAKADKSPDARPCPQRLRKTQRSCTTRKGEGSAHANARVATGFMQALRLRQD